MSADRNSRSKYSGRWGSNGSHGERDDKNGGQQSTISSISSSSTSYYSRYRQPSGSTYHSSQQSNRGSRLSYDSNGTGNNGGIGDSSSSYNESYTDSYRPSKRPYNTNNSYKSSYPPRISDSSSSSNKPFRDYPSSGRGGGRGSSYFQSSSSSSSRYGGPNTYKSSSYKNLNSNNNSSSNYYERRAQRYSGGDSSTFRTNPEETSDHYYPQRDKRSSLINSTTSTSSFPNRVENTKHLKNDFKDRSISPLNSDPYNDVNTNINVNTKPKLTDGYERKSRPSLIPSNFKDEEEDDDYELNSTYKDLPNTANIRHNEQQEKQQQEKQQQQQQLKEESHHDDHEKNNEKTFTESSNDIQQRITEKLPLTLEHKEELDKSSSKNEGVTTRESSEESSYEPQEPIKSDSQTAVEDETSKLSKTTKEDEKQEMSQQNQVQEKKEFEDAEETAKDEEESDNYEPEVDIETESTLTTQPSTLPTLDEKPATENLSNKSVSESNNQSLFKIKSETQVEEKPKIEKKISKSLKKIIVPLHEVEGCIFPMNKIEQRVWELKNHPREDIIESNPYLLKRPIKNFNEYPFFQRNLLVHEQGFKLKLMEKLSVLKGSTFDHKISLWNEYSHRSDDWNERCSNMEKQLKSLYPSDEQEFEEQDQRHDQENELSSQSTSSTRRGRYHGDTVRSEAEFLEILKNLEKEKESDPLYKAEQLAAKIPDMILNPIEKHLKHLNINNLVLDKEEWAKRIYTDPIDTFTKHEHEMFCEAFLAHPKRFGRISSAMGGLRTSEECVLHYYKTKKSLTDYKQLVASKKKRNRKGKVNRRISKSKNATATNTSAPNTPTTETPGESAGEEKELALENFIPKEAIAEELYTETGRRRRAAAPVFDSTIKTGGGGGGGAGSKVNGESEVKEDEERKRSLEGTNLPTSSSTVTTNETNDEDSQNKVPPKKKPRGSKPKKKEETVKNVDNKVDIEPTPEPFDDKVGGRTITSYWSVRDINQFVTLIGEFGTQWSNISERMKTKSTTMVRNYFMKHAQNNGWLALAEAADKKNMAYQLHVESSAQQSQQSSQSSQQSQQSQQPQQPQQFNTLKKPPLGVFNSHGDLPSNVNIPNHHQIKHEQSMLPSMQNLPPFSRPSVLLPQTQTQEQQSSLLPLPSVAPAPTSTGGSNRSNPFSITSLLNPSEESKPSPSPPTQVHAPAPAPAPVPVPTHTPVPAPAPMVVPGPASITSQPSSNSNFTEGRNFYSSHGATAPSNGRSPNVMSMLNNDEPSKPFNPLSTLVAAADDSSRSEIWNHQGGHHSRTASNGSLPNYGGFRPYGYTTGDNASGSGSAGGNATNNNGGGSGGGYPKVPNAPYYQSGYSAPYSESIDRSRDIFNPAPVAPAAPVAPSQTQAPGPSQPQEVSSTRTGTALPSNFGNLLQPINGSPGSDNGYNYNSNYGRTN